MIGEITRWLPEIAFHQLWLGGLIAGIAWAAARWRHAWTAGSRYWLWFGVLVVSALLPLFMILPNDSVAAAAAAAYGGPRSALIGAPATADAAAPTAASAVANDDVGPFTAREPRVARSLAALLVFAWLTGVACKLSNIIRGLLVLRRWRRAARPVPSHAGEILESADVTTPMVVGVMHPCILLPIGLRQQLTAEQLEFVLEHERAHIRRADPAMALIQRLIAAMYFHNPVIHWVLRQIERERECACDDIAGHRTLDREGYASSLIAVARHVVGAPVPEAAIGAVGRPSELAYRIERLLGDGERRERWRSRFATSGVTVAVLATIAVLSPAIPLAHAQNASAPSASAAIRDDSPPMTWSGGGRGRALVAAVDDGDVAAVRALLDSGANINAAVIGDGTPLIVAVCRGDERIVRLLLERGANVNQPSRGDGSPLICAASRGNLDLAKVLVEHGADVNAYVPGDETPLINAARAGRLDVVDYLVSRGANVRLAVPAEAEPGSEIRSPLSEARKFGQQAVIKRLIEMEAEQAGGR